MSLNQYGTLFCHFTHCCGLILATSNTMEFTHHQNQCSRSPQACILPVCVSNQHFRQCGVPWDDTKTWPWYGGVVPESLEHKCKCDWIENVAHTVKTTVQKNPGWLIHERLNLKWFGTGVSVMKNYTFCKCLSISWFIYEQLDLKQFGF